MGTVGCYRGAIKLVGAALACGRPYSPATTTTFPVPESLRPSAEESRLGQEELNSLVGLLVKP
jgi:hypothetical protein